MWSISDISLLPADNASRDLRITVIAPTYTIEPTAPQDVDFVDGESVKVDFYLIAPLPDGGLPRDGGQRDGGPAPGDGGPKDAGIADARLGG